MVFQVLQFCVRFSAHIAGVWPMALMVPSVFPEHRGICETLPTLGTKVGLLSSVRTHVHLQFGQRWVAFGALTARVRTLPTVLCHMDPQAYSLHEGFTTLCAYKGFLPSVRAAMVAQLCWRLVRFVTVGTLEGALGRVSALML